DDGGEGDPALGLGPHSVLHALAQVTGVGVGAIAQRARVDLVEAVGQLVPEHLVSPLELAEGAVAFLPHRAAFHNSKAIRGCAAWRRLPWGPPGAPGGCPGSALERPAGRGCRAPSRRRNGAPRPPGLWPARAASRPLRTGSGHGRPGSRAAPPRRS